MKTMKFILFLMMLMLIAACSKNGLIPGDSSQLNGENALLKNGHCEVFTVKPNGHDDTGNILAAFESAKASGPGSTVRLEEGKFTIGMIEVRDFDGYFTGSGKGKTVIANFPGLPCEAKWEANKMPALFTFIGGSVVMSHMTFHLSDGEACVRGPINDAVYGDLACVVILADYSADYVPDNRHINGVIDNVDFIAGNDGGYGTLGTPGNYNMAVYCGSDLMYLIDYMPLSNGNCSITNCHFENGGCGPDIWAFDENSTINIENNVISDGLQQIFVGSCMGSKIAIKGNKITNGNFTDIFIDGSDYGYFPGVLPKTPTKITVQGNVIQSPAGVIGLYMRDYFRTSGPATVFPQLFDVSGNIFSTVAGTLTSHYWFYIMEDATAIQALNLKDAAIWNNKFYGTGTAGVYIDGDEASGTYAENVKLIGNNLFNATYTEASVYLGPYSRNCKVVGVSTDKVVDEGVNNSIIGTKAHKQGAHSGKYLHNNFRFNQENLLPKRIRK